MWFKKVKELKTTTMFFKNRARNFYKKIFFCKITHNNIKSIYYIVFILQKTRAMLMMGVQSHFNVFICNINWFYF